MAWLMSHEECPLCHNNFLSLDGNEGDERGETEDVRKRRSSLTRSPTSRSQNEYAQEDISSLFRGVHLLYMLNQLHAVRDRQMTATIHLESMELPGSQRVIVEIRETEDDDDIGANLPTFDE